MKHFPVHARKATLIVALLTSVAPVAVLANPVDGTVAAGSASIASSGSTLTINQASDKAVIDWRGFDVGAGETTNFVQPSSHALTLNRVGSGGASRIDGNVTANGNIVIVNPNGIVFGAGSHVDVNGLVATTANISNANAMAGNLRFDQAGNPTARIENHGSITARDAGLVGLVAPNVINSGIITARLGRVHLASGDTATVDLYGDGLIEVKASDALTHQLVANTGTISAQGGTIALTAAAGRETVDSLVQVSGLLDARSIGTKDGHIFIYAQGAPATSNAAVPANVGRVVIAGTLDVSNASGNGGRVEVAGNHITLAPTAIIDANGTTGGGIVRIGADVQGSAIIAPVLTGEMQGPALPTADEIILQAGSSITANALTNGNGGTVVLYADTRTEFAGTITADGAGTNGEGGFVETSGRVALTVNGGTVSATGRRKNGTWLLDPADITITTADANSTNTGNTFTATETGSTVDVATITAILNGGTNVTIQTSNDAYTGNGDIFVNSAILTSGAGSLTLSAYRNVIVNSAITLQGGELTLRARNTNGAGAIYIGANINTNGGNITMGGGNTAITAGVGFAFSNGNTTTVSGNAGYGIAVISAATINSGGGNIIMNGSGHGGGGDNKHGIWILGTVTAGTVGSGNVTLTGKGNGSSNSGSDYGVYIQGGTLSSFNGTLTVAATGGGAGTGVSSYGLYLNNGTISTADGPINLSATGGANGTAGNSGIVVAGTSSITSTGGNISLTGTTGTNSSNAAGIDINGGSVTNTGSGTVTLTGTARGKVSSHGVYVHAAGVVSTTANTLTVTGTGGTGAGTGNSSQGVFVSGANSTIKTTGGNLVVTGSGGTGNVGSNHGIYSNVANGIQTSNAGNITLNGIQGAGTSYGINGDTTNGIITTGTGTITAYANSINLTAANSLNSAGVITLAAYGNIGVSIGTAVSSTLNISTAMLANFTGASFIFGSTTIAGGGANTSDLTINSTVDPGSKSISFISGNDINIAGNLVKASGTAATYLFQANRDIYNSSSAGITSTSGALNLTFNADYDQATVLGGRIAFTNGTFTSNGGNIVLSGGANVNTEYAQGRSGAVEGIKIDGATLNASTGSITARGRGESGSTSGSHGVYLLNGGKLLSSDGAITITGLAGNSSSNSNSGVVIAGATSIIQATGTGSVTVNGTGNGVGNDATGVYLDIGQIKTSSGTLAINAQGGPGSYSSAMRFTNTGKIISGSGAIIIKAAPAGDNLGSLVQNFTGGMIGDGTTTGNITIYGDRLLTYGGLTIQTTGVLTMAAYSNIGISIGTSVGGTSNIFNPDNLIAGSYVFGSRFTQDGVTANTGDVTINTTTNFGGKNVTFISGRDIRLAGALNKTSGGTATYIFQANRNIYNSSNAGISSSTGLLNLTFNSDYNGDAGTIDGGAVYFTGGTMSTNGGSIVIGGGGGTIIGSTVTTSTGVITTPAAGFAVGNGQSQYGVSIANTLNAGGGNILINGNGYNTAGNFNYGVYINASTVSTSGSGTININGIGAGTSNSNTDYGTFVNAGTISNSGSGTTVITGIGGGAGTGSNEFGVVISGVGATVSSSGTGAIIINGKGSDTGTSGNNAGIWVSSTTGVNATGTGAVTLYGVGGSPTAGAGHNGVLVTGKVQANGGALKVTGINGTTPSNSNNGIWINGGTVSNTSTGTLTLTGSTSATTYGFFDNGVQISNAGVVSTVDGLLTISGTGGGLNAANDYGVYITGANSIVKATGTGAITIAGAGGNGNTSHAISIESGGAITGNGGAMNITGTIATLSNGTYGLELTGTNSRITNSGAGTLTISGTSSGNRVGYASDEIGVHVGSGGVISTVDGLLTVTGTSNGGSSTTGNSGIKINGANSSIQTTGAGNLIVAGNGGAGTSDNTNYGIWTNTANAITTSGSGSITLRGLKGTASYGLYDDTANAVTTTGTGNITIYTDVMFTNAANNINSIGSLTLATYANSSLGIGTAAGNTVNYTDTNLSHINAASYIFGSTVIANGVTANLNNVNINTPFDFGDKNVTFVSGGNINIGATVTKATGAGTATYVLQANGNITNSAPAGIVATSGAINLTLNSDADLSGAGLINLFNTTFNVNGGTITLNSNGQNVTQSGSIGGNETINSANGTVSIGLLNGDTAGTRSLTVNAGTSTFTTTNIIGGTNKLNNITITADDVVLGNNLSGAGTLTLQPFTNNRAVNVNNGVADGTNWNLSTAEIARLIDGWAGITIGSATGTSDLIIGFGTWTDPVTFRSANRKVINAGTLTGTGNASFTFTGGWADDSGNITTAGGKVDFSGLTYVYIAAAGTITTSGGDILFSKILNDGGLTATAGAGTISFGTNGVTRGGSLTASATSMTFAGAWGVGNAVGNVTLTSVNSIVLPEITTSTGKTVNITVTGAGNSITENNNIIVGTGSNITLSSDDIILGGDLSGTGTLTLQPNAVSRQVYVNYGTANGTNWNLSTAEIAHLVDGWSQVNIGRSDTTGPYPNGYAFIGASNWVDPTTFRNYDNLLYGNIAGTGNASLTFASTSGLTEFYNASTSVTTQNANITLGSIHFININQSLNSNGGNITAASISSYGNTALGTVGIISGGGNISLGGLYQYSETSGTYNIDASTGTATFSGGANTAANVNVTGATVNLSNTPWGAGTRVGSVTITSGSSVSLPTIATGVGQSINITVTGAGNSITTSGSGPLIAGTGGNITLTSDDLILNNSLSGTGNVTLQPYSTSRTVNVNAGTADGSNWNLSTAEIARLVNGWSSVLIGNTGTTGSSDIVIGTSSWSDPLTFRSSSRAITSTGSTITTTDNASINFNVGWLDARGTITSAGAVAFNTTGAFGYVSYGSTVTAANANIGFAQGISLMNDLALNAGTGNISVTSGIDRGHNLTATANAITLGGTLGGSQAVGTVTLTSATTLTLPSITAASILAQATGAAADIVIAAGKTLTASGSGNALTLVAGRNFINNSGGSALAAASGRWLVYSTTPVNNTRGGLLPDASDFNRTYAGNPPASIGAGNRFEYATATAPVLTYTTGNGSAIYGDAYSNASTTSTYSSGLISGDTLGTIGLTGTSGGTNTYVQGTTDASVTPYSGMLTATVGSLASKLGYTFAFTGGDLTVNKRTITASVTGSVSKQYDGTTAATLSGGSYSLSNVYGADAVGIATTAGTYDTKDTATGKTVSVSGLTLNGAKAGNYVLSSTSASGATGIVTQKALTITADNKTITYGGAITPGTASYTGFIAGEDATYLTTGPVVASANSGLINAGLYNGNYTASGAAATNYSISYVAGNLTVAKKALDVTADNKTITYGDAITAGSVSYNGFIAGQDASFLTSAPTVGSGQSGIINAGMYAGNYTPMGGTSSNYSFNYFTGDLTVAKKNLNVTADNKSVTYGTAVPAGTLDYNGFITGEDASFLGTAPSVASTASGVLNVGTYSGNYTPSGGSSSNYSFTYVTGNLSVTAAGLNVTAGNRTVTYGTAVPADTYTITGYLNGDDVTALSSLPTLSSTLSGIVNAGSYLGNFITSGGTAMNYYFNYIPGDLTVSKKSLNVTADNKTITYGSMIPTGTFTYNGFVNGENASVLMTAPTVSSTQSGIVNAGSYAGNFTLSGGSDGNYSFNYVSGGLNVGKASLTITANDRTITYGTAVPTGTYSITGYVNGENATALSTLPGVASVRTGILDAGSYANNYIASGAAAGNYTFTYVMGDLAVLKTALFVTTDSKTKLNGAPDPVFTGSNTLLPADAALISWAYAPAGYAGLVGSYVITATATDAGNRLANYLRTDHEGVFTVNADIAVPPPPAFTSSDLPDNVSLVSQDPASYLLDHTGLYENIALHQDTIFAHDDGEHHYIFTYDRPDGTNAQGQLNLLQLITIAPQLQTQLGIQQAL